MQDLCLLKRAFIKSTVGNLRTILHDVKGMSLNGVSRESTVLYNILLIVVCLCIYAVGLEMILLVCSVSGFCPELL